MSASSYILLFGVAVFSSASGALAIVGLDLTRGRRPAKSRRNQEANANPDLMTGNRYVETGSALPAEVELK